MDDCDMADIADETEVLEEEEDFSEMIKVEC